MTELTEPPPAADEVTTLRAFLDFQRDVLRRKTEGLTVDELSRPLPPTTMTLGGLLKHLAVVEVDWVTGDLHGRELGEPWASVDWDADPDWEWHSARFDTPEELRAIFDDAVREADRGIDEGLALGGLGLLAQREGRHGRVNLRWILVHLIEEYARHLGHADLLREAIDGSVGD